MIQTTNKKIGYLTAHIFNHNKSEIISKQKDLLKPYECNEWIQNIILLDDTKKSSLSFINYDENWDRILEQIKPNDCILVTELISVDVRLEYCIDKIKRLLEKKGQLICIKSPFFTQIKYTNKDLFLFDNCNSFIKYFNKYTHLMPGKKILTKEPKTPGRKKKIDTALGNKIKQLQQENYNITQIALKLNISRSTIYNYFRNKGPYKS